MPQPGLKMIFKPHDYQHYCISRMIRESRLGLFLRMGLGKTVITLTALNELITYRNETKKALIIAPKKVAETTWTDEAGKWEHLKHLRISKILGNQKQRIAAVEEDADIYVINRENIPWLVDNFKRSWKWDTVIIDELSSFKNPQAKRFKKLKTMLPFIKRLYGLTGTPAANGLLDLWAQMYLIDQGVRLEKTITAYKDKYFLPDKRNATTVFTYKLKPGCEEVIKDRISDICISLKQSDYVKLPPLLKTISKVILPPSAVKAYKEIERDMFTQLPEGVITAANAGVVAGKLLQIASGAVYDETGEYKVVHSAKLEALAEILEAAQDENILVFYNFQHEKELILENFPEAKILENGSDITAWNNGQIKMLLTHPASAGYGLNLQKGGHVVVWFSPTWNLEQYEQANARLHRQGQAEPVTVIHLIAAGSIDEVVLSALKKKDKTQSALLEALQKRLEEIKA